MWVWNDRIWPSTAEPIVRLDVLDPILVAVYRVTGESDYFNIAFLEFRDERRHHPQLRRADRGEVGRVGEENAPAALSRIKGKGRTHEGTSSPFYVPDIAATQRQDTNHVAAWLYNAMKPIHSTTVDVNCMYFAAVTPQALV